MGVDLDDVTVGIELELLAPRGTSRRDVARVLAEAHGGQVHPVFHPDSEPALVPGTPVFENLTLGFEVRRDDGSRIARIVDDLTLQADLDRTAPPRPGWFRIVSDDRRLLHLMRRHGRADAGLREALAPLADLYGTDLDEADGIVRVTDPDGAPLALGAPLPGERERPCELVTAPIRRRELRPALHALLAPLAPLGLTLAAESATHVHVDRTPFEDATTVRRLVHRWEAERDVLLTRFGANPRCRRRGTWTPTLRRTVDAPGFTDLSWPQAKARLAEVGLSKFVDLNLKGLAHDLPGKPTIEVRFLPGLIEVDAVVEAVEAVLDWLDAAARA